MNERFNDGQVPYTGYTDTPDDNRIEGFDPEVADDLGIATDYESLQRQIESGKEVGRLTTQDTILLVDGGLEHAQVEAEEGHVTCANCNKPGCPGCGRS